MAHTNSYTQKRRYTLLIRWFRQPRFCFLPVCACLCVCPCMLVRSIVYSGRAPQSLTHSLVQYKLKDVKCVAPRSCVYVERIERKKIPMQSTHKYINWRKKNVCTSGMCHTQFSTFYNILFMWEFWLCFGSCSLPHYKPFLPLLLLYLIWMGGGTKKVAISMWFDLTHTFARTLTLTLPRTHTPPIRLEVLVVGSQSMSPLTRI